MVFLPGTLLGEDSHTNPHDEWPDATNTSPHSQCEMIARQHTHTREQESALDTGFAFDSDGGGQNRTTDFRKLSSIEGARLPILERITRIGSPECEQLGLAHLVAGHEGFSQAHERSAILFAANNEQATSPSQTRRKRRSSIKSISAIQEEDTMSDMPTIFAASSTPKPPARARLRRSSSLSSMGSNIFKHEVMLGLEAKATWEKRRETELERLLTDLASGSQEALYGARVMRHTSKPKFSLLNDTKEPNANDDANTNTNTSTNTNTNTITRSPTQSLFREGSAKEQIKKSAISLFRDGSAKVLMMKRGVDGMIGESYQMEGDAWARDLRKKKADLVGQLEDREHQIHTSESLLSMPVRGMIDSALLDNETRENKKLLFKKAVNKVIYTQRMANALNNNFAVHDQVRNRRKQKGIFSIDSHCVMVMRLMVTFASILDMINMMIDVTGYHGCQLSCHELGGSFAPATVGMMGHLGQTFYTTRMTLGIMSDIVYLCHFAVNMHSIHGHFEFDMGNRWSIMTIYFRKRFAWDLLTCAPFYWLFCTNPWCRVNRVLNIITIGVDEENVAKLFYWMNIKANMQMVRLMKKFMTLMLYVHILTCITMVICYRILSSAGGADEVVQWFDMQNDSPESTFFEEFGKFYLYSQLWVWSNVTGWGGNWSPRSVTTSGWTYINQFLGVFIYMWIFGEIVSLLQNFDLNGAEAKSEREKINRFLQLREVPPEMQYRVHAYLDEIWSLKQGVDEKEVLRQLPQYLRHDLSWFLNKQFLEKIPMFFGADTSALLEVNQHLTMTVATTGEFLCRFGELGRELHFVLSGEIHILNHLKECDIQLFEGSCLGEVCVVFEIPSPYDALVKSVATIFSLPNDKFDEIITKFPALLKRIEKRGRAVYGARWNAWSDLAQELDVGGGEHKLDDEQVEETSSQDENKLSFSRTWSRKFSVCPTVGDNAPTLMHFRKSSHRNVLELASLPVLLGRGRGEAEGGGGGGSDIEQRTGGSIAPQQEQQVLDLLQQHQSQLHHQNQQHYNTQQQLSNLESLMSKILEAYTKEEASSHKKSNIAKLAPLSLPPQPTFRAS